VSASSDLAQKTLPAGLRSSRRSGPGPAGSDASLMGFLPLASRFHDRTCAALGVRDHPRSRWPRRTLPPLSAVFADAWTVRAELLASFGRTLLEETLLGFIAGFAASGCLSGITFAYVRTLERLGISALRDLSVDARRRVRVRSS